MNELLSDEYYSMLVSQKNYTKTLKVKTQMHHVLQDIQKNILS